MYRVRWKLTARDYLAAIWITADSATLAAITSASHQIDQALARDPYADSESRDLGQRVKIEQPLGVQYRVDDGTRTVFVLKVWLIKPRTP